MSQKPYLISLASYDEGNEPEQYVKGWNRYLDTYANLKDTAEPIFVELDYYPGHLYRWDYIPEDLDPKRWWIFTDTPDVVFQTPLPDLDVGSKTGVKIWAAWEGVAFKDSGWWVDRINTFPQFKPLLDQPIFNVGCWAMKGDEALDFIAYLTARREQGASDEQALYNVWLASKRGKVGIHPELFTTLYAGLETGLTTKDENGVFLNREGRPFCIVHANGSTKVHLD